MKRTIAVITAIVFTAILLTACAQGPAGSAAPDAESAPSESAAASAVLADAAEEDDTESDAPEAPQNSDDAEDAAAQPDETDAPEESGTSDESITLADPVPVPDAAPQPAAGSDSDAPADAPADTSAGTPAYGAIPFSVAAGTDKWWAIDSTDDAYWAMQEQINAVRAAGGLPALTMDSNLSAIASSRCESFVAGGPFDHSGMVTLSEICAMGSIGSASSVCAAWVASENHYANIMRTDISSMGVGCWFCDYEGNQFTYWVVTFG